MAAQEKTGAEALVDVIIEEGVEYVFGLPGGSAIPIFDALVGKDIRLVLARHEQGAVHMADGYARATGKTGVALVTSGPGATNTVTGLFTALMDSIPLVVIAGQMPVWTLGLDAFQEADVSGITYPCVKHSYLVKDVEDIPRIVHEAFYLASSGRPGPVLIDMPKNVSGARIAFSSPTDFHLPGYSVPGGCGEAGVARAAALLKAARRPLLVVGHGALISGAEEEVRSLVETMQIPVANTLLGKGVLPETHELNLGMLGMHGTAYANKAVIDCDLIMSIGSRWDDRIVGDYSQFCVNATKIHLDIDPAEIDKVVHADLALVGDAKTVLGQLIPRLEKGDTSEWVRQLRRWRKEFPLAFKKEGKLRAQHVIQELYRLTGGRAVVTTDVGQHQMWAAQFFLSERGRDWISSGGAGTMGFGLPSAIGAQLGRPGETVIAVVGDGGFQMTVGELATLYNLKIPVKIIIINNHYLGMVRQWQNLFYDNRYSGVDLEGNPDFVKLAQAYGIKGLRVTRAADLRRVLQAALAHPGPVLVDAEVEHHDNVFPMIPAGAPHRDMLLEPPRRVLEKPTGGT
ncbi:MAG TPA: biosynthetic-type acetolactate synthase large subunit [Rectinemataceae bacterium]|nr:biosynthetic-type acetolactate synthase large subunit [Rectinemataceae bacterium]